MTTWLLGAGPMALDYAKVLVAQSENFEVIGRGRESANRFYDSTGIKPFVGGLQSAFNSLSCPERAIVAVPVEHLVEVCMLLSNQGVKRVLVEKPGALNAKEFLVLKECCETNGTQLLVGYNRRFYASVSKLLQLANEDGGILSIDFEFTEWSHRIKDLAKGPGVLEHWAIGNSSHIMDLAFFIAGFPKELHCITSGSLTWHSRSARFSGMGITTSGAMFSYSSDWEAPGRWCVNVKTAKHRFILSPLERLQCVDLGTVDQYELPLEDELDTQFKPGLFRQVQAFLEANDTQLVTASQQLTHMQVFEKIAGYT
jgi:predicted dehydrogenase